MEAIFINSGNSKATNLIGILPEWIIYILCME